MHLAVASGTPTMGLFSTTSTGKYGPYGTGHTAIDTRVMSPVEVAAKAAAWFTSGVEPPESR